MTDSERSDSFLSNWDMGLSQCPRCGNPARDIDAQIASCSFCRRRAGQIRAGEKHLLEQPTADYPTWSPDVG